MASQIRKTRQKKAYSEAADDSVIQFYSRFEGYSWLSNFSYHAFDLDGAHWPTVEHFFQAMKFPSSPEYQEEIRSALAPGSAKGLGRSRDYPLRSDWEDVKELVMYDALMAKFSQHEDLRAKLIETCTKYLVERTDTDAYWGDGKHRKGKNRLGHLLMEVRKALASLPNTPIKTSIKMDYSKKPEPEAQAEEQKPEVEKDEQNISNADESIGEEISVEVEESEIEKIENELSEEVDIESVVQQPVKTKSHTTASERATKRKHKTRDRRNVWKDDSGSSMFQIADGDPQAAVLFKDADVVVPMTALPEPAKHVMKKHQWVMKYSDRLDYEDDSEDDEEDSQDASPTGRVSLGSYLNKNPVSAQVDSFESFSSASECLDEAKAILGKMFGPPNNYDYKLLRQRCVDLVPVLFSFVDQPQPENVMMELLETIDSLNTCSTIC